MVDVSTPELSPNNDGGRLRQMIQVMLLRLGLKEDDSWPAPPASHNYNYLRPITETPIDELSRLNEQPDSQAQNPGEAEPDDNVS